MNGREGEKSAANEGDESVKPHLAAFYRTRLRIALISVRPGEHCARVTTEQGNTTICLACGEALAAALQRFASLRCHDCRDTGAPIRPELLPSLDAAAPRPVPLRAA